VGACGGLVTKHTKDGTKKNVAVFSVPDSEKLRRLAA